MTYLPNLIKRIDSYYQEAMIQKLMSIAAPLVGGNDLYRQMVAASREILNPDVSDTVRILAEMFRKTVEMDDGFNFIYRTIDGIKTDLDPEEPEQLNVENLLNHVESAISSRASQPDSSAALRALQQTASDTKRIITTEDEERRRQQGTQEEPEVGNDDVSAYEAALTGYNEGGGEAAEHEEGFGGEENAKGVFDMSGGVSLEQAGQGKGRGYRQFRPHSYKDWAQVYASEKVAYENQLNADEMMLSTTGKIARHHTGVRNGLRELVGVLDTLEKLTKEAVKIEGKILVETEVAHPAEEKRLSEIQSALRENEHRRIIIKRNIRKFYQGIQLQELDKEKALPQNKNPKNQILVDQKIALQKLRMSGDRGYGEEAKQRKVLIDSLSNDPNLSQELITRQLESIQKARAFTTKMTEYNRKLTMEVAKTKGTQEPVLTRDEMGGVRAPRKGLGKGRIHEWKLNEIALEGLVTHLTQRMATERGTVKQKVTDKLEAAQKNELKPFMDDVAKAATKAAASTANQKDKLVFLEATKRLNKKMVEFADAQPAMVLYLISLRSSKFLYRFRDQIKKISGWLNKPGILPIEEKAAIIQDAIATGKRLSEYYRGLQIKYMTPGKTPRDTSYNASMEVIDGIVHNLSQMVEQ